MVSWKTKKGWMSPGQVVPSRLPRVSGMKVKTLCGIRYDHRVECHDCYLEMFVNDKTYKQYAYDKKFLCSKCFKNYKVVKI